ncbi:DNA excision repair protein ERCC-3 [Paenibacillus sp. UNC496MF]|uniref:DNA repair helicase XPB n=1 Tax=Paenibacillus sp. UNC496MF TaxID=1502753 RepID=UPI0008F1270F|nr:DNA repair helicase XPB [Paenibacillus sp. UNC496MF]SFI29584.1 DNA excision repair protein ERCC-3 [Paenibacillus sp. UNC496MF]
MLKREHRPLSVQADMTVLLDDRHEQADAAREQLNRFADLIKRPGHIHTYRISPMSLWNAASAGMTPDDVLRALAAHSAYDLPLQVVGTVRKLGDRYGKLLLEQTPDGRLLLLGEEELLAALGEHAAVAAALQPEETAEGRRSVKPEARGLLKQELIRLGYPVLDKAGYRHGEALDVGLRTKTAGGRAFRLRDYQERAVNLFYREGQADGGSGVLVLPCGAGKTVIGIAALARLRCDTLILTSNVTSVQQWKAELLDKTSLREDEIGTYAASSKEVRPVTIATYQILTSRRQKSDEYGHMRLFGQRNWGLIIYDEVHLLPAPVFRMTADLQATRRLGLTATLVREDGREEDVFSLIGPKRFDLPWKTLETRNWIASLTCTEVRIPLASDDAKAYMEADEKAKIRLAGENKDKIDVVRGLLERHAGKQALVIGQYLTQLHRLAEALEAPVLTGELPHEERTALYDRFKTGEIQVLVVSKVANFAVDLPEAAVAIQVSGSYGSRQEEAQRIGRVLRPKAGDNEAWFYTVVTQGTKETEFASRRQLFLLEQGYRYELTEWREPQNRLPGGAAALKRGAAR